MAPKLYILTGSPPCRAVLVTAKAIGVTLDVHIVQADKGELQSPEYLKINPQHKVPALVDDGHIICDSHAINTYLVGKYGKDDSLYPNDLYKRSIVDEKLYFDAGVIFPQLFFTLKQFMNKEIKSIPPQKVELIKESYGILEKFLEVHKWVAGNNVTIADFSIATTVISLDVLVQVDPNTYSKLYAYMKRCKELPWFDGDNECMKAFITWYKSISV